MTRHPPTHRPTDRRVRRTRALLLDALLALIVERGYDRITVQTILDRADVGRSTFYAHFRDIDDLLLSGLDRLRADLHRDTAGAHTGADSGLDGLIHRLFAHVAVVHTLYAPLLRGRSGLLLRPHLQRLLTTEIRRRLERTPGNARTGGVSEVTLAYVVSGVLGVLEWWLAQDPLMSATAMAFEVTQLVQDGLGAGRTTAEGDTGSSVGHATPGQTT